MSVHRASEFSLAQQMQMAAQVLANIEKGHAFHEAWPSSFSASCKPGVQSLCFLALRYWGWSGVMSELLLKQGLPVELHCLLRLALTLLYFESFDYAHYAEHTVVNQAVKACRLRRSSAWAASLVNACLRRYLREQEGLNEKARSYPEAVFNFPLWWIKQVQTDWGDKSEAILRASHQKAPMVIRVNTKQMSVEAYGACLVKAGFEGAVKVGEQGWMLKQAVAVERLPLWQEGAVSVQDGSAQMAIPLLQAPNAQWLSAPYEGQTYQVLDACAAPGGKTTHHLERWNEALPMRLVSMDIEALRLKKVNDSLARLRLTHAKVMVADAAQPDQWPAKEQAVMWDAILLDAPCTGSGIVRRHPDIAWLRRASDIEALSATQWRLLQALWPRLKPKGRLVYATCSIFKAEGESIANAFCHQYPEASWQAISPGHIFPAKGLCTPQIEDNTHMAYDGFFYAVFDKCA